MTPTAVGTVFGRARLKMATGSHVDVFREAAAPGEKRRYSKRFLCSAEGDLRDWTEREWRILTALAGHDGAAAVPAVAGFDRGAGGGAPVLQTYDAGVTLDHWATLLPLERDGAPLRHVFHDCAHWWALAHHLLLALEPLHRRGCVHLDLKADNACLPLLPSTFEPLVVAERLRPAFDRLALIDFAFALVPGVDLAGPLPIGCQREFAYQSPRLLAALAAGRDGDPVPTRDLDWRCDLYSLAALLRRCLPAPAQVHGSDGAHGWTDDRYVDAQVLLLRIVDSHDRARAPRLPHDALLGLTAPLLAAPDLARSLDRGWTLAGPAVDAAALAAAPAATPTPSTLINLGRRTGAPAGEPPAPACAQQAAAAQQAAPVTRAAPRPPPEADADADADADRASAAAGAGASSLGMPDDAPPSLAAWLAVQPGTADDGATADREAAATTPAAASPASPWRRLRARLPACAVALAAVAVLAAVAHHFGQPGDEARRAIGESARWRADAAERAAVAAGADPPAAAAHIAPTPAPDRVAAAVPEVAAPAAAHADAALRADAAASPPLPTPPLPPRVPARTATAKPASASGPVAPPAQPRQATARAASPPPGAVANRGATRSSDVRRVAERPGAGTKDHRRGIEATRVRSAVPSVRPGPHAAAASSRAAGAGGRLAPPDRSACAQRQAAAGCHRPAVRNAGAVPARPDPRLQGRPERGRP